MYAPSAEPQVSHHRLRALQGIYLAQTCLVVLTRIIAYTWLLEELGSADLPRLYLLQALPLGLLTFGLMAVVDRVGRASLFRTISTVFLFGVLLAYGGVLLELRPLSPLFLLFGETAISVFGMHFWLLTSELLSPEQARRHFPSLALVGALGAILAGLIAQLMTGLSTRHLLLSLIPPALLCVALAWWVQRRFAYRVGPRGVLSDTDWRGELRQGLELLQHSSLLRAMGGLTATITATGLLIDYLYNAAAERTTSIPSLLAFFGGVQIVVNLLQLVVVLTLRSRIFTALGLIRTLSTYPAGGMLLAIVALVTGATAPLIGMKIFDRLQNYVVLNPGLGIMLGTFPREHRGRASFVFGGLIKPLAIATTGLILVALQGHPSLLLLLTCGLSGAILLQLRRLHRIYRESLLENLRSRDFRLVANSIEALAEPENRVIVPELLQFLRTTGEPVFRENILLAAGRIGDPRCVPALLEALEGNSRSLKHAAVRSLARFQTPEVQKALLRSLRQEDSSRVKAGILSALSDARDTAGLFPMLRLGLSDPDPRVKANAVEAIGLTRDPRIILELLPFLEDQPPRVVANAIVALASVNAYRPAALEALQRMFATEERNNWLSALYAAGEVRDASFFGLLLLAVESPDLDLRRNAAIALGKRDELVAVAPLVSLLSGHPEQGESVAMALDRLGPTVRERVLESLLAGTIERRERGIQALRGCGANYPEELEQLVTRQIMPIEESADPRRDVVVAPVAVQRL